MINGIIGIAVVLLIFVGLYYSQLKTGKEKIKSHLRQKGFRQIKIQAKFFTDWRYMLMFDVEYLNKKGVKQKNSCLVRMTFPDQEIYWEKRLR